MKGIMSAPFQVLGVGYLLLDLVVKERFLLIMLIRVLNHLNYLVEEQIK